MSRSNGSRDLDIVVLDESTDSSMNDLSLKERREFYPSVNGLESSKSAAEASNQEKHVVMVDLESQDSLDELSLIHQSAHRHHSTSLRTFGRVHLVEEMEAIAEVDRALELDELRDQVQGKPHSRTQSINHVRFQLSISQEEKAITQDTEQDVELDPIGSEAKSDAKPDIFGAIFNLMNYALGAGILALPYAFRQAGLIMGALLVIAVGSATIFGMFLLLSASRTAKAYGYEQLARVSYGDNFAQFVKITIIIDSFGALSAYMILIAETTTGISKIYIGADSIWTNKILVLTLVTIFIMLPLCSLKNINYLGFTSALSLVPLVYFLILQIVYLVKAGGLQAGIKLFNSQIFYALPIVIFSFSSQQALFPLYTELQERNGTEGDIKLVVTWSLMLTAACYLFSGTIGIFTYPTTAFGNVLNNFPSGIPVDILLITTAVSIVLSFPVILWPARVSADRLFFLDRPYSYLRFVLEAAAILAISFVIAVAVPSFSTVLGLFGSLTNTCIGYVLPPLYFLKIDQRSWKQSHIKKAAIALLVIGTICGLVAAGIITSDYISSRLKGTKPEGD
jgi:amino acid permease